MVELIFKDELRVESMMMMMMMMIMMDERIDWDYIYTY
jgi:hypothetical protein